MKETVKIKRGLKRSFEELVSLGYSATMIIKRLRLVCGCIVLSLTGIPPAVAGDYYETVLDNGLLMIGQIVPTGQPR